LASADERVVFFKGDKEWGTSIAVHIWKGSTNLTGSWPGQRAEHLGGGTFKFVIPETMTGDGSDWQIIWNNNGGGKQTGDLKFQMRGLYTAAGYQSLVTKLCEGGDTGETPVDPKPEDPKPEDPEDSEMCLASADERAVFFQGSDFGTAANVYMWDPANGNNQLAGAWPGTAATHLGDGKFKFVVPASATGDPSTWMIIWNGNGKQTADLTFTMHGIYNFNGCNGKVTTLCEGGEVPDTPDTPETPAEGITVKAKVPAAWTETITAWVWPTGGDGREVMPTKEGEWYVVTENTETLNIIFKNGAGWNGNSNQTEDMTFTTNTCIQLTQSGDKKATYTVVNCEVSTDVEKLENNQSQARKILYNGALYLIMPNGDIYNAAGVLVNKQ
jgi:hypothetical protein